MKVIIGIASSRKDSNSVYLAQVFKDIIQDKVDCEVIDFTKLRIERYKDQVDSKNPIYPQDDFIPTVTKILDADAFILFSPVHWCNFAEVFVTFQNRYSEALHRPELEFSRKMFDKICSCVMVSAEDPSRYRDSFWKIQEEVSGFSFMKTKFVQGLWFIANGPGELKVSQSKKVGEEMEEFANTLGLLNSKISCPT
jgi:multimeric flavodoxin WrbA